MRLIPRLIPSQRHHRRRHRYLSGPLSATKAQPTPPPPTPRLLSASGLQPSGSSHPPSTLRPPNEVSTQKTMPPCVHTSIIAEFCFPSPPFLPPPPGNWCCARRRYLSLLPSPPLHALPFKSPLAKPGVNLDELGEPFETWKCRGTAATVARSGTDRGGCLLAHVKK